MGTHHEMAIKSSEQSFKESSCMVLSFDLLACAKMPPPILDNSSRIMGNAIPRYRVWFECPIAIIRPINLMPAKLSGEGCNPGPSQAPKVAHAPWFRTFPLPRLWTGHHNS